MLPLKVSRSQAPLIPLAGPELVYCHMVQVDQVVGTDGDDPLYCARQNQQFPKIGFTLPPSMLPTSESE